MFDAAKNTKQQANVGLGIAIAYYSSQFCTVCVPLNDSQDYDLVVDKNGILQRVQVKTTRHIRNGSYIVLLSMQGGSRAAATKKLASDFVYDLLFVVTGDGLRYEIPRSEISHIRTMVTLSWAYEKFRV